MVSAEYLSCCAGLELGGVGTPGSSGAPPGNDGRAAAVPRAGKRKEMDSPAANPKIAGSDVQEVNQRSLTIPRQIGPESYGRSACRNVSPHELMF